MIRRLYYGDNLEVLRQHIGDESVDLIYLDPPFNSNASYNVLFKTPAGKGADAAIEAFDDTWTWGPKAQSALMDIAAGTNRPLAVMMEAMRQALGENSLMAYLAMMAVRLVELHRVLKPTGSLYLHCDPTASHYLKMVLDGVFGPENFRNEIVWKRSHPKGHAFTRFATSHDVIFAYAKDQRYTTWNPVWLKHPVDRAEAQYSNVDEQGRRYQLTSLLNPNTNRPNLTYEFKGVTRVWRWTRERMEEADAAGHIVVPKGGKGIPRYKRYLDEQKGIPAGDFWDDIPIAAGRERLGYPTQKPRALLERIIAASSNPGDLVLDPFCGCGTAVDAAEKLGRQWIGIDITHLAIGMIEDRMRSGYPGIQFETIGVPKDLDSAERLAADDPHQFQQWICWQVGGFPREKKGGDKGVDGWFNYLADKQKVKTGVIEVKAGDNVNPAMVRALAEVMRRDGHEFGLFLTKVLPTRGMEEAANALGLVETPFGRFPALQIFTLAELFQGRRPQLPPLVSPVKKAS
ncbi:MAG: DNA methyltransferase, partial [Thermaurantiacus sp.]